MKNMIIFSIILLFIITSPIVSAKPLTREQKVHGYCAVIIKSVVLYALKSRTAGYNKNKLIAKISSMPEYSDNRQIKADIKEIVNFVYNEGRSAPDKRVEDFLVNEWCFGQADKLIF